MAPVSDTLCLAVEHHRAGRLAQAETCYERLLRIDPRHADALHLLGVAAHQRGDHHRAVDCIRRAIAQNDAFAPYHSNLGAAYRSMGRLDDAIGCYREALRRDDRAAEVHFNLANALKEKESLPEAADSYRQAVQLKPEWADPWIALAETLRRQDRLDEAVACCRRALAIQPESAEAEFQLGGALRAQGRSAEAIEHYARAVALRPAFVEARINLGCVYDDLGELDRAVAAYDQALALKPDSAAAHFNRALAWLRAGDFERGWTEYEWRWRHNGRARAFAEPVWNGASLENREILVYSEQGIGDEIQFSSCVPDVVSRARACLLECDARLVRLFARSFPQARVFARAAAGAAVPVSGRWSFDCQIAAGSLPGLLRRNLQSFPQTSGWLRADEARVAEWKRRYARLGSGIVVGVSWRGGKDPATRKLRSTPLADWRALLALPGVCFVNLQYGDCRDELNSLHAATGVRVADWEEGNPLGDLDEFAARVKALDLVIAVDNATVHLAGALGTTCWTLLPFAADWRWMRDRTDSPWYPAMRLFRQSCAEDWTDVFRTVIDELRRLIDRQGGMFDSPARSGH